MTTRTKNLLARLCPLLDFLLVLGCVAASRDLTNALSPFFGWPQHKNLDILDTSPFITGIAVALVPFVLSALGFYHRLGLQRISTALRQIATFTLYYLGGVALYQVLRSAPDVMMHVLLVNIVLIPVALFLRFLLVRWYVLFSSADEARLSQVLLVGSAADIDAGWNALPSYWKKSLHVAGRVEDGGRDTAAVQAVIESASVGQCIVFGGLTSYVEHSGVVTLCELQGIDVYVRLSDATPVRLRADINEVGRNRLLILSSTPAYSWAQLVKSECDRFTALLLLILSSPLWLIAAIGIKLSDPKGPVFYRQQRSGRYGKPFSMWKFRSMYADADKRLDEIKAQYGNEMNGPMFKLTNDPRIFRFGHFLRKSSIDELPQLLNVLVGDMSIVGPRPLPTYETAEFPEISNRRRLSVKPGLTCYWQIEGRSEATDFKDVIEKDLRYIDNWSLWLDFTLFLRTIPAVLFGRGAK